VSKAFTKEDDDTGFTKPPSSSLIAIPPGPFRITAEGAEIARAHSDERVRDALARAEILPAVADKPERAALGVTVLVNVDDEERRYRLVSAEERALLGDGCSIEGPIGRALLGATVGDVREVRLPRGVEELEIVELVRASPGT